MKIRTGNWLLLVGVWMLGLWLVALPGLGQENAEPSPTTLDESADSRAEANSYSLLGTVLNVVTGEPVRRAAVQVAGHNGSIALTDAGGHFALEGLAEGNVFLTVLKPGFYEDESQRTLARVGKDAAAVVLKLTPWSVISGRVTAKDEQSLEGMQIRIFSKQNVEGRLVWVDVPNQGRTNEDGEFRIAGLQAGTYYVAVEQGGATTLGQSGVANAREQTFAKVYYPGVPDLSAAGPIEVAAGQEAEANFTLTAEPVYQISGSFTGASNPINGLVFARKAGEDSDYSLTAESQDGKFQVKLPAGSYSVSATAREGTEFTTPGATVVIRADAAELQVPLSAVATVPVEVEKEQSAGGGRRVPVQGMIPGLILQLMPLSESRRGNLIWRQAGGIQNVGPGTYRLQITTSGDFWVKSAQSGGVDLLADDLTVVEGEQPDPIKVTLGEGAGVVSGTVTTTGDAARVLVLLAQSHGSRNFMRVARVMQGNFAFPGVPPGDYAILALDGGDELEYANPDVLRPYLADAEQVSVRPRATTTVYLEPTSVKR